MVPPTQSFKKTLFFNASASLYQDKMGTEEEGAAAFKKKKKIEAEKMKEMNMETGGAPGTMRMIIRN